VAPMAETMIEARSGLDHRIGHQTEKCKTEK
jgi:hypothetical protein